VRRIRANPKAVVSRGREIRFLALIAGFLCALTFLTTKAVSTIEPDISDLSPVIPKTGDYTILNWIELERRRHSLQQGTAAFTGARIQALGYMMERDQPIPTGKSIREFVLLPDAGNFLHPLHRFGDQMIAVHLTIGHEVEFVPKGLVWAKGILRASSGDPAGSSPLYDLDEATVILASKEDIMHYFR
jgi:hypothetical protein